jgi:hypothetical protein
MIARHQKPAGGVVRLSTIWLTNTKSRKIDHRLILIYVVEGSRFGYAYNQLCSDIAPV